MIQFTGKRYRYSSSRDEHVKFPSCVDAESDDGIRVRKENEEVHLSVTGMFCIACGIHGKFIWTDDEDMWNRHTARCNFAYNP